MFIQVGGKIHFLFSDGTEMCEEYDLESNLLLGRLFSILAK